MGPNIPVIQPKTPFTKPNLPVIKPKTPFTKPNLPVVKPNAANINISKPNSLLGNQILPTNKSNPPLKTPNIQLNKTNTPFNKPNPSLNTLNHPGMKPNRPMSKPNVPFNTPNIPFINEPQTRLMKPSPIMKHTPNIIQNMDVHVVCPFPKCQFTKVFPVQKKDLNSILHHFLSNHQDFSKVICNQLRRHQSKKATSPTTCPFDACSYTSDKVTQVESHYGISHKIGEIVFLQFSVANKWQVDCFRKVGFLNPLVDSLVQCSHCFEVMTRAQLAKHISSIEM